MRAVRCINVGSIEDLVLEEVPPPDLRPGTMRVSVEAAGLNYVDALFVQGRYQIKPTPPFTPGSELAGTVTEVSDEVTSVQVGDRIVASIGLGGFAEEVVIAPAAATMTAAVVVAAAARAAFAWQRRPGGGCVGS